MDTQKGYVYYSFTTMLLKTDLDGVPLGSVTGLAGHLGCITFNSDNGVLYGSLEQKHDAIGAGIIKRTGWDPSAEDAFYLVAFDVDKIDRMSMDAEGDGVMTAVYLADVVKDYKDTDEVSGKSHRYGCSGIDGLGFGPVFGAALDSEKKLMVCYGVYSDTEREDNDYQVILQYDISAFDQYALPLNQATPHHSGPQGFEKKYFLYTGNTVYGVQNLEYDASTREWIVAVYRGKKQNFTPFPMFIIDGARSPELQALKGRGTEMGEVLFHRDGGLGGIAEGVLGYTFPYGQTGIAAVGDGTVYFSHDLLNKQESTYSTIAIRYKRGNDAEHPFIPL
ncbi:MAG: hypothetical protein IJZ83_07920 [Clostridia bacterium]|nr:hypothetical protein [Clostridia bacterium]